MRLRFGIESARPTDSATLPNDGANAQSKHFDNMHTLRYIELFIVGGNGITGNLQADVYNTTFRGGYRGKDSAPQELTEENESVYELSPQG